MDSLAPFLSGEAQHAYRHLPSTDHNLYSSRKVAIRAHFSYSLAARTQKYIYIYQLEYDPGLPAQAQVMNLLRLMHSWLEEGDGPGTLDRLVLDRPAEPECLDRPAKKSSSDHGDAMEGTNKTEGLLKTESRPNPGRIPERRAILAHFGYSLAARAQKFHQWKYGPGRLARAQMINLLSWRRGMDQGP